MLQNIRDNSQSWIAKTIVGVFIVLLSLTGFDAIISATSNKDDAAEVNGQAIAQRDVARLADQQRQQMARQLGEQFNPDLLDDKALRRSAVEALVQRALLLQATEGAGFAFSDLELDRMLLSTPEFQTDGKFDPVRFDQYLSRMGYTRLQFRQLLREEMLMTQLRAGLAGSGFITDAEVKAFAALERQTRDFASITIEPDVEAISIGDEELKKWYDENASRFMTPEQVVVSYVELKKESFFDQVSVAEEQLQAAYQSAISNISEQRKASHILLETSDELGDEQTRAKLVELRERVLKGEDFAVLAREFSADPGSAASGGDLGFAGRGVWDQAFEDALFALKEGELSQPVKTQFGWHLIRLDAVQAPEIPSLEEMRPQLVREVKEQQVEPRFVDARKQMETLAYESGDLQQVAEEMGLQVQQTPAFGREGGEGLAANRQVLQAAFSEEVLNEGANSSLIELDPETVVVLRVKEHLQPRQQPLAELGDSLRRQLREQRAAEAAQKLGAELVKVLRAGGELPMAQEWKQVEAATRSQEEVDPQVLQAVFRLPRSVDGQPVYGSVQLRNGAFLLLRLDGVSENADALGAEELASFRRFLSSRSGQEDFKAFQRQLAVDAEVKYY